MSTALLRWFLVADSEHLRSRAAQLLVVAMKAYESGEVGLADVLITHAMEYLDEARTHGGPLGSQHRLARPPRVA